MAADERPPRRRDLRDEADYLPESLDDLLEVRQRLLDAGHRPQVVGAMISWLLGKANGEHDTTASDTRATYRRILRELPTPTTPPSGPKGPGQTVDSRRLVALRPCSVGTGASLATRSVKLRAAAA